MSCANSIFDEYFLSYLYNNANWLVNKHHLFSWWGRETILRLAYYGTWLRTWSRSLVEPYSYSVYQYCQPLLEFDWRWGIVFGGLGVMFITAVIVWGYFAGILR